MHLVHAFALSSLLPTGEGTIQTISSRCFSMLQQPILVLLVASVG